MTVKVDLTPETEAGLKALAQAQGLSLEAYAEKVLRERSAAASHLYQVRLGRLETIGADVY